MEDFMGQKSCSSNTGTSSSSTNFIYGSAAAAANTYDNCFYGRGGDGGFPHHHQYDNDPAPPMVKIESEKIYCAGSMQHNLDNQQALKSKIIFHPHYSNLLQAYMDCQKVGAPPEVVGRLTAVQHEYEARQRANLGNPHNNSTNYKDPELDQFMEAYYDMLIKYKEELTRPIHEAVDFMRRIESQLSTLNITSSSAAAAAANTHSSSSNNNNNNASAPIHLISPPSAADDKCEVIGSSEEEENYTSGGETTADIDPRAEDRELKNHLLRKYSGYISSLKQELSKKKKKGKLPKEARQKLLSWWELHYKWPYPSESEKVALAETTGLDQKQINNWFINQRKRHWKPSEDMQFMVMQDPQSQHHLAGLYMQQQQDPAAGDHHYMHHLHPHPDHPNYRLGP